MRPLIGVTGSPKGEEAAEAVICSEATTEAIYRSGGQPVVIPISSHYEALLELVDRLDGLLLSGGSDIDPLYFGEEPIRGLGKVHPQRDELEVLLIQAMIQFQKPILGICRGCQILNVATGGTMYQDVNSQVSNVLQHTQKAPRYHASHTIEMKTGSKLHEILQTQSIRVNSFHHQANRTLGKGFRITAMAADGVMEAFESEGDTYITGVQWHPECMIDVDESARKLFQSFIDACDQKRSRHD